MSSNMHAAHTDIKESRNLLDERSLAYFLLASNRILPGQDEVYTVSLATKDQSSVDHIISFKVLNQI